MTPAFIRAFEGFRAALRNKRAQEKRATEVDFESANLKPGLVLVELIPKSKSQATSRLNRIFAAVERQEGSPSSEPSSGPNLPLATDTAAGRRKAWARAELRLSLAGLAILICGSVLFLKHEIASHLSLEVPVDGQHQSPTLGKRPASWPVPRTPLKGHAVAPCLAPEKTLYGSCWLKIADEKEPCSPGLFYYEGDCYAPTVREEPTPQSLTSVWP
jgi:hypothetical protein